MSKNDKAKEKKQSYGTSSLDMQLSEIVSY